MRIVENLDLAPYNSYRLHARCARAFFPDSEEEVRDIYCQDSDRRKVLIGSGHNIILSKEWYDEDFIIFNGNFNRIAVSGTVMEAEAGAFSTTMSEVALEQGLSGLEIFYDIPSSLGGAVVMNAGASGEEIKDLLINVRYLDLNTREIHEVSPAEAGFAYRNSLFQADSSKVVLAARLQLRPGEPGAIRQKMDAVKEARWAKQPREYPNAGSVFKRPAGYFVGPMIEEVGLKGHRVGGAVISPKHAGIFVNAGAATGQDLIRLIEHARGRVKAAFGVDLEVEQRVL